jgi:hypothetical protein
MNASLDLSDLGFTLLDECFLVSKFGGRQLRLEDLSLSLLDSAVVLLPMSRVDNLDGNPQGRESGAQSDVLAVFFFHSNLDPLYDRSLALRGDLLRTLK